MLGFVPQPNPAMQGDIKMYEHYMMMVQDQWNTIVRAYLDFEEKKPVILFDIQERKIYAYPYQDFKGDLSAPSQKMLEKQYRDAIKKGQIVIFVLDSKERVFISCNFALDDTKA
ncbi:MAG: hypothetical protein AABZ54_05095 [Bacteroidota bacterium]